MTRAAERSSGRAIAHGAGYHGRSNGSPTSGLRGRRRAADRLNLIRVMPAQGWWRGPPARRPRSEPVHAEPTREQQREHDAIVVGAGVIGLACAWRAAQRGLDVLRARARRPGAGASGVAAGMLAPVGEATWGEERLLDLALASHALWPAFAAELAEAPGADAGLPAARRAARRARPRRGGGAAAPLRAMASSGSRREWLRRRALPRARAGARAARRRRRASPPTRPRSTRGRSSPRSPARARARGRARS